MSNIQYQISNKLSLNLPWGNSTAALGNPATKFNANPTLGSVLSGFIEVALYLAGFMMFFWMVWGVFEYILARGNKESLAKARGRIWWGMLGFLILIMAIFISQYVQNLYFPNGMTRPLSPICNPETKADC